MRKASDVWFEENPFEEDAPYTGPGKYTIKSNFPKTRKASWTHDGTYLDEPNAYLRYNKADAIWGRDADDRDPLTYFGKTIWDLKRFGTHAYDSVFGNDEVRTTERITTVKPVIKKMPYKGYTRTKSAAARGRAVGRSSRRRARDYRRSKAGPMTWKHMRQCVEKKFHEITRSEEAIALIATGAIDSPLQGISQGTTAQTRLGIRLFGWSLEVRGQIKMPTSTDLTLDNQVRLLIVLDKQANGSTPTFAQVLNLDGSSNPFYAYQKEENRRRFTILKDRFFPLNVIAAAGNGTANDAGQVVFPFTFYKKWANGLKVVYQTGASGGVSDIMDNNIWVMAFAKDATQSTIEWTSHLKYTD